MLCFSLQRTTLALAIGLAFSTPAFTSPAAASLIPSGFDTLMEGQTEYLDVTLLGHPLGIFAVTVRPDTVRFEDPRAVIDALLKAHATLDDEARAVLLRTLESALPTHENLACSVAVGPCGYLATERAAVIFDRQEGVLALFLRPDWFARKAPEARYHTVSRDTERAFLHRQNALYASGRGFRSLSVTGQGVQGLRDGAWLGFDWRMTRQQSRVSGETRWQLPNAYVRQDLSSTHYVQAGRMDMRNLSSPMGGTFSIAMQPFQRIEGMRIGTTQAYTNQQAAGKGTPLTLILAQPARVDAYRNDELLGSSYLQGGVQAIDTSLFPVGTYPVTLRIVQNGAVVRNEVLPFTREGGSAARVQGVQWFAQSGRAVLTDLSGPRARDVRRPAMQAGVRFPLGRGFAFGQSLSHLDGRAYHEARIDAWLPLGKQSLNASWSRMAGSDGARGHVQQLNLSGRISWNLYRYSTSAPACSDTRSIVRLGVGCTRSMNLTASTAVAGGQFTLGQTRADTRYVPRTTGILPLDPLRPDLDRASETASRSTFASYTRVLPMRGHHLANLGVNAYRRQFHDGRRDVGGFVSMSFTHVPVRAATGPSRVRSFGTQVRADRSTRPQAQLRFAENHVWQDHGYREIGMQASAEAQRFNAAVLGRYDGPFGRMSGQLSHDRATGARSVSSVSGTYASAFALSKSGFFAGPDAGGTDPMAGLIVSASGDDTNQRGSAATLRGSSLPAQDIRFGQRLLIPLAPFRPSHVETSDASEHVSPTPGVPTVDIGLGSRQWFISPGRVGRHAVTSTVTYTYVGRLDLPAAPSAAAPRLLNAVSADMDDRGGFVAAFDHQPETFYAWQHGNAYACRGDIPKADRSILRAGVLRCEAVPLAVLPELARSRLPAGVLSQTTLAPAAQRKSP